MNLRTQFWLTKHSCLLVPASQNIVLGVSEMSFPVASLVPALRANAPPCREGGGAGCCLRSENSQSWIPCLWLKIGAAGSGRQAGAQGHLLQRR